MSGGAYAKEGIMSLPYMSVMKQIVQKIELNCNKTRWNKKVL